jgi:hypothetical protein
MMGDVKDITDAVTNQAERLRRRLNNPHVTVERNGNYIVVSVKAKTRTGKLVATVDANASLELIDKLAGDFASKLKAIKKFRKTTGKARDAWGSRLAGVGMPVRVCGDTWTVNSVSREDGFVTIANGSAERRITGSEWGMMIVGD